MDMRKRNVSKHGNVIFDFFCFGNVLETSINIYIYIYIYICNLLIFIMFNIS